MVVCLASVGATTAVGEPPSAPARIRVATYNVEFGTRASPEQIGEALRDLRLDVVAFCEAPAGDWTARVGRTIGMEHAFVGKVASAGHKDKFKSLLSRTPLRDATEFCLRGVGWNPASAVRALTTVHGRDVAVYSLHICHRDVVKDAKGRVATHSQSVADFLRTKETAPFRIVMGDYNSHLGHPALVVLEDVGMQATWIDLGVDLKNLRTGNSFDPNDNWGVIDHIFYNRESGMKAVAGGIVDLPKPLSDHKPVWAELTMP